MGWMLDAVGQAEFLLKTRVGKQWKLQRYDILWSVLTTWEKLGALLSTVYPPSHLPFDSPLSMLVSDWGGWLLDTIGS